MNFHTIHDTAYEFAKAAGSSAVAGLLIFSATHKIPDRESPAYPASIQELLKFEAIGAAAGVVSLAGLKLMSRRRRENQKPSNEPTVF